MTVSSDFHSFESLTTAAKALSKSILTVFGRRLHPTTAPSPNLFAAEKYLIAQFMDNANPYGSGWGKEERKG